MFIILFIYRVSQNKGINKKLSFWTTNRKPHLKTCVQPHFYAQSSQAWAVWESLGFVFPSTDQVTQLINHLFYGIIIFQTETTFLRDLHIVWYVVLYFTNPLSGIKCPKLEQDKNFNWILTISDAKWIGTWNIDDFLQKLKKLVRIVLYGPAISQSDCRKAGPYQLP